MADDAFRSDAHTTLADLKSAVMEFVHEREWHRFHSPKNLSMALAAEAAELMEHFLWDTSDESAERADREEVADELADIAIYAIEFANITGIDLTRAIEKKIRKNAIKYPVEKAKGNSLKYDEL